MKDGDYNYNRITVCDIVRLLSHMINKQGCLNNNLHFNKYPLNHFLFIIDWTLKSYI